jgi:lysyl-tRNA synthetase class 2
MDLEMLRERSRIIRRVRAFFDEKNYLELDTPLLAPDLIPESCLEVFQTSRMMPGSANNGGGRPYWLVPSPEIWMKRIIARHRVSVYQICKCFRNGESSGHLHSPEFTMLEYYTMDADARRLGLDPPPGLAVPALYDLIFIHAVEPRLKGEKTVALTDYPAFTPCLARQRPGGKTVERWELYGNGIELANCYSEETDPEKVRRFFESEAAAKERSALVRHRVDSAYWKHFLPDRGQPFPRCSGVALGLDRLIMALTGRSRIDGVLPFPMD